MLYNTPTSRAVRLPLSLMLLLIVAAALFGGSNRGDVIVVVAVRLVAILCIGAAIAFMPLDRLGSIRRPLLFLLALAIWMILQIVPLPPAIWTALPGRERFADAAIAAGMSQPWMPISIVPTRTLGSLLSLLVPLAALILVAWLPKRSWYAQIYLVVGLGAAAGILALMQISGSVDSLWQLYDVNQNGGGVGFFANRNHQAAFMACMFPMLAAISVHAIRSGKRGALVTACCAIFALFLLPLIFITGSRAGLALTPVSLLASVVLAWPMLRRRKFSGRQLAVIAGGLLATLAGLTGILLSSRSLALRRLSTTNLYEEQRVNVVEPIVRMIKQNFPFGTGFGTFDPAFRAIEPYSQLFRTYLNHAHSDPLEFLSDGGLPTAIIFLAFFAWWGARFFKIWFRARDNDVARMASIVTALWLGASVVDYPLRTPLASVIFALAIAWMAIAVDHKRDVGSVATL